MARYGNPTEHIDRGLDLMRKLRSAQSGLAVVQQAAAAHPEHEGFCIKCKTKVKVKTEALKPTAQKGVHRHHGPCGACGTSVSTFKSASKKAST